MVQGGGHVFGDFHMDSADSRMDVEPRNRVVFLRMETSWKSDHEIFATARRELFTAVVGDIMDQMGLLRQFLPPAIQPLREDMS